MLFLIVVLHHNIKALLQTLSVYVEKHNVTSLNLSSYDFAKGRVDNKCMSKALFFFS